MFNLRCIHYKQSEFESEPGVMVRADWDHEMGAKSQRLCIGE